MSHSLESSILSTSQSDLSHMFLIIMYQNRKRKHASSSGAANSTGTANTAVPSNSSPSTPSTHTAGDASTIAGSLPHVNMQKTLGMYGSDVTDGIASSSNQLVLYSNTISNLLK